MLGGLGPPWIRAVGYGVISVVAAWAGWRDLRRSGTDDGRWPAFWFACAAIFAVLAIGRAADWGDLLSEVGRRDVRAAGWYEDRRELQVLLIGGILTASAVAGLIALSQAVMHHRVRYVPLTLVVLGLAAFVGVRLASLHQVDVLLHNRSIDGLQLGAGVELFGIGLAAVLIVLLVTRRASASGNQVEPDSLTRGHGYGSR